MNREAKIWLKNNFTLFHQKIVHNDMKTVISIVTPVYNRPELICSAIESVMQQTFQNWEYIVVDDLSTDNTWQIISEYSKKDERILTLKRNKEPKGAQTCRNIGLHNAKGQYVIFLDSDDFLMHFCLEQRMSFVEKYPNIDLVFFPKNKLISHTINDLLISFLSYKLPLQTTDSLWDKSFLIRIDGFNEKLHRFQDVELSIRALLQDNVKLLISDKHLPDSQYLYMRNASEGSNYTIVYSGLITFITEVSSLLEKKGQIKLKPYLRFYLRSWLIHYHSHEISDYTKKLILFFREKRIISIKLLFFSIFTFRLMNLIPLRVKLFYKILYYTLYKIK